MITTSIRIQGHGLLLVLVLLAAMTSCSVNGFAPSVARTNTAATATATATATSLEVGAVFEDKPHMMIGGRGYQHLVVDMNSFAQARAAALRRKRLQVAKLVAGYTAVVCGSVLLRQMLAYLAYVPYYYKAYPLTAAMATCGLKSIIADAISQIKSWTATTSWDWRRSFSGLVYGATILGVGSKLAYSQLLPRVCPAGLAGIVTSCAIDNFLLAPAIWLPGAYLVKGIFQGNPIKEAVNNYVADIQQEGLLANYWKLWVPAQCLNFAIVPKHLQVPFVAAVGFLWYFVLSSMAYKEQGSK